MSEGFRSGSTRSKAPRRPHQPLQRGLLQDEDCRAFHLDEVSLLEVAEDARDGLARRADHLRHFLVGEQHFEANASGGWFAVEVAPLQEEFTELLRGRLCQTEGTDLALRRMVFFAELLRGVQAHLRVSAKEPEKVVAFDEVQLRGLERLR